MHLILYTYGDRYMQFETINVSQNYRNVTNHVVLGFKYLACSNPVLGEWFTVDHINMIHELLHWFLRMSQNHEEQRAGCARRQGKTMRNCLWISWKSWGNKKLLSPNWRCDPFLWWSDDWMLTVRHVHRPLLSRNHRNPQLYPFFSFSNCWLCSALSCCCLHHLWAAKIYCMTVSPEVRNSGL